MFTLRAVEGYAYAEVATRLGITAPSARTHFQKARANLRKMLQKISEDD